MQEVVEAFAKRIEIEDNKMLKFLDDCVEAKKHKAKNNFSKSDVESIFNIIDNTNTILWNGPAGYFENPNFAKGSIEIAKKIIEKNKENKIYSVVGGGDTVSLINSLNAVKNFNFVSTAGGAFLEYLEGKELPGISALN